MIKGERREIYIHVYISRVYARVTCPLLIADFTLRAGLCRTLYHCDEIASTLTVSLNALEINLSLVRSESYNSLEHLFQILSHLSFTHSLTSII